MDSKHFDRQFQLWRYSASHSQLLLMSHKDEHHPTRLMLLFKGVVEIFLPCEFWCRVLEIESINHHKKYLFHTPEKKFHIFAYTLFEEEDELDQNGPSRLVDSFSSGAIATGMERNVAG